MTPKKKPVTINSKGWYDGAFLEPILGGTPIDPKFLVIHFTAGASAQSSIAHWKELNNGILAHFVIDRDGTIYQCRSCELKAGHAGKSKWTHNLITFIGLNAHSIGIELANGGNVHPTRFSDLEPAHAIPKHGGELQEWESYPDAQLDACATLSSALVDHYALLDIVGHDDIAPKRKLDPGPAFPMEWLKNKCEF